MSALTPKQRKTFVKITEVLGAHPFGATLQDIYNDSLLSITVIKNALEKMDGIEQRGDSWFLKNESDTPARRIIRYFWRSGMKKSIFHYALGLMNNQNEGSLLKSLDNVHHKGLFSLVIGGNENGSLTRVFIATKKIKMSAIQLHSHTYDLSIGVIKGEFMHHTAMQLGYEPFGASSINLDKYRYRSPLNGGNGLEFLENVDYFVQSSNIPEGGEVLLSHTDIHSVSVSKGTMWVLQEHGFKTDESVVLGRKFITDGLYTIPKQYQVNDMWQKVYASLKKLTHGQEQNDESSD